MAYILTNREEEVLKLIVHEMDIKKIAVRLGISIQTVHFHRRNLYRKIETDNKNGLLEYAYRHSMISLSK
jgi:DNA-binding CsgD family transcriptional regulator